MARVIIEQVGLWINFGYNYLIAINIIFALLSIYFGSFTCVICSFTQGIRDRF